MSCSIRFCPQIPILSMSQGPPFIACATLKLGTSCPKVIQEDQSMYIFHPGWIIVSYVYWAAKSLQSLHLVQNAAADQNQKKKHISPVLASLHWLPVKFKVDFKILLPYKTVHGIGLSYLNELRNSYHPTRVLCSHNPGL